MCLIGLFIICYQNNGTKNNCHTQGSSFYFKSRFNTKCSSEMTTNLKIKHVMSFVLLVYKVLPFQGSASNTNFLIVSVSSVVLHLASPSLGKLDNLLNEGALSWLPLAPYRCAVPLLYGSLVYDTLPPYQSHVCCLSYLRKCTTTISW